MGRAERQSGRFKSEMNPLLNEWHVKKSREELPRTFPGVLKQLRLKYIRFVSPSPTGPSPYNGNSLLRIHLSPAFSYIKVVSRLEQLSNLACPDLKEA